jgi:hypothetical protein
MPEVHTNVGIIVLQLEVTREARTFFTIIGEFDPGSG